MRIKITADSTCDLSPELIRANDIEIFPLFVNKGDESFRDCVDIQPADIFAHVAAAAPFAARPQCRWASITTALPRWPGNMTQCFM